MLPRDASSHDKQAHLCKTAARCHLIIVIYRVASIRRPIFYISSSPPLVHPPYFALTASLRTTMPPRAMFSGPDPYTATRQEFTQNLISTGPPSDAAEDYAKLWNLLNALLDKLAHHSAMSENLQQTYMTPAKSKNKVYFMWDFVGRTRGMLVNVDPSLSPRARRSQAWTDCQSRSALSKMLIQDKSGKLEAMNASTGHHDDQVGLSSGSNWGET